MYRAGLWASLAVLTGARIASAGAAPGTVDMVFASERSGVWRIWGGQADGSNLRQLTHDDSDVSDVDPAFGPDGKTLLFSSTRSGKIGVWRLALAGGPPTRLCDGDQADWSPDGKRIALRRTGGIVIRELATGSERRLTPEGWALCSGPAWSPDGKTIAFANRAGKSNGLFLVSADGGAPPTKLFDEAGACEPRWAPDGSRIAYETEVNIWTIRPDGKDNRMVTYFGGVQRYPCWSPDGSRIVFCQGASEQGPWELYAIPAAGGTPTRLTTGSSDMHPHWKWRRALP
ncbi:PD40 domain-containing protein [bacterium]|nr:PD40 domain-containing protein [bacterium]